MVYYLGTVGNWGHLTFCNRRSCHEKILFDPQNVIAGNTILYKMYTRILTVSLLSGHMMSLEKGFPFAV